MRAIVDSEQRPDSGRVRPVIITDASNHPELCLVRGTMALFEWGLINSPLASLGH
jgi:hypothetical protein